MELSRRTWQLVAFDIELVFHLISLCRLKSLAQAQYYKQEAHQVVVVLVVLVYSFQASVLIGDCTF